MHRIALAFVALGLLWGSPAARAQGAHPGPEAALRGLTSVTVALGELSPEAAQAGASGEALVAAVREKVGRAGIPVQGDGQAPRLLLDLQASHLKAAGLLAFSVTLSLEEELELPRQPGARVAARTWTASSVGTSLSGRFAEALTGTAERLADRFVDAFAVANPPR